MPPIPRRSIHLPAPGTKRAVVIGAGSFGTAVAVLLARGGLRTTLQTRTQEQAEQLAEDRENRVYLPRCRAAAGAADRVGRRPGSRAPTTCSSACPRPGSQAVIDGLEEHGLPARAAIVSLAKGLVPPDGTPPTRTAHAGASARSRTACIGGPAHAREMVSAGAGLVAASTEESLASAVAGVFVRAGVVCEESNDPIGVELAGAAKNAAALASGATEAQGLNAAGAAAGHIFAEVWRWAEALGARPESMIGLAGTGDLVATALAPESRNRRAGELLAQGTPSSEIPARVGQAIEALDSVPLLARAITRAGIDAPVTTALAQLIAGELPLDDWVAIVRTTLPPPPTVAPDGASRLLEAGQRDACVDVVPAAPQRHR